MIGDGVGEAVDLRAQFIRDGMHAEVLESAEQRMREAVQAVAMRDDALTLDLVEHSPHLFGRELVMIEKRSEVGDGLLKVNIVFPERVIGVDEEGLGGQRFSSGQCGNMQKVEVRMQNNAQNHGGSRIPLFDF